MLRIRYGRKVFRDGITQIIRKFRIEKHQRRIDEWTARQLGISYEEYVGVR